MTRDRAFLGLVWVTVTPRTKQRQNFPWPSLGDKRHSFAGLSMGDKKHSFAGLSMGDKRHSFAWLSVNDHGRHKDRAKL